MDKFDEIMKNAVEGYKAPFDEGIWDNISNELNSPFDQAVKEAVDKYEAPYNPQVWQNISRQLGPSYTALKWIGGTAAALTLLIGGAYYLSQDDQNNDVVENNTIALNEDHSSTDQHVIADDQNNPSNTSVNTNSSESSTEELISGDQVITPINPIITNLPHVNDLTSDGQEGNDGGNQNGGSTSTEGSSSGDETITVIPVTAEVEYNAHFNCELTEACAGTEFIFSPENMSQNVSFVWSFGDGNYSAGKVGAHTYDRPGTYTVTLTLNHKQSNKVLKTEKRTIVVNPNPATQFTWEQSDNLIPTVTFINLTDDVSTANWDIKGLRSSTQNQFDYTFRKKGTYMVELTTTNEFGCASTVQKPITIEDDYNLLAPTAFSPNGDFKNDYFIPEALRVMNNPEFTMTIHDKSGKLIYQTNNVNMPWDGLSTEDNTPAPAGAYVWTVILNQPTGEVEEYQGQVIIIR